MDRVEKQKQKHNKSKPTCLLHEKATIVRYFAENDISANTHVVHLSVLKHLQVQQP